MSADVALRLLADFLWNALVVASPLLITSLVVGVLISVMQVATQIQEMSLTFVPKVIVAAIVLVAAGPWMIRRTVAYAVGLISAIPSYL